MNQKITKSVKSEEESLLRRILSPLATILGRGKSATVEKVRFTPFQVNRVYKLFDSGKYSISQISMMVGLSQSSVRSWLDKRKPKVTRSEIKEMTDFNARFDENGKRIPRKQRTLKPTSVAPPTADQRQEVMIAEDPKFWIESQGNPRYWAGATPPQSIATQENWNKQRKNNNACRATTHKYIEEHKPSIDEITEVNKMRIRHTKKEPVDHHGYPWQPNRCSCGHNEPEWVKVHPIQDTKTWIRRNHNQNFEKKKYAERKEKEQKARELGIKPEYYCSSCNNQITDEQSKKTSQEFGKLYCDKCIPNNQPKGGFIL